MDEGKIDWGTFSKRVRERFGGSRPLSSFIELTDYDQSLLSMWRNRGWVSEEVMEQVEAVDPTKADTKRFKGYHSAAFYRRVVELSNEGGRTIKEMAEVLSEEFDRKITTNAVKAARYRHRDDIEGYQQKS